MRHEHRASSLTNQIGELLYWTLIKVESGEEGNIILMKPGKRLPANIDTSFKPVPFASRAVALEAWKKQRSGFETPPGVIDVPEQWFRSLKTRSLEETIRDVAESRQSVPHHVQKWAQELIDANACEEMSEAVEAVAFLLDLNPIHAGDKWEKDYRNFPMPELLKLYSALAGDENLIERVINALMEMPNSHVEQDMWSDGKKTGVRLSEFLRTFKGGDEEQTLEEKIAETFQVLAKYRNRPGGRKWEWEA